MIKDSRGDGMADIVTFAQPTGVLVFQHTFSGTTYICAVRAGERGWVLISHGKVASTVLNAAIAANLGVHVKAALYTLTVAVADGGLNDVLFEEIGRAHV